MSVERTTVANHFEMNQNLMLYVGVNIAKNKHDLACISETGEMVMTNFKLGKSQSLRKTKTGRKDAFLMAHKLRSDVTIERYQIDRDDYISSTVFLTIPKSGVFPAARMLASYKPLK